MHLFALMTPGPDFFFISRTALSRPRTEVLRGVAGISIGVAVWAALALMGLHLLMQTQYLQHLITLCGGLYLCWLGLQILHTAYYAEATESAAKKNLSSSMFWQGFFVNLSNPKAVIYFASVFSLFVKDNPDSLKRIGLFTLVVTETFLWFILLAILFSRPMMRRIYARLARRIDILTGLLFIVFGLYLLLSH